MAANTITRRRKAPAATGRRPILVSDPARVDRFFQSIRLGAGIETSAAFAGIGSTRIYEWIALGEGRRGGGSDIHREFVEQLAAARAQAEVGLLAVVHQQARTDGKLALDALSRLYPDRYARRSVEVTGEGGGPIRVAHSLAGAVEYAKAYLTEGDQDDE